MNEVLKSIGFQSINRGIGRLVQQELNMWDQSQACSLALPRSSSQDTTVYVKLTIQQHKSGLELYVNVLAGLRRRLVTPS